MKSGNSRIPKHAKEAEKRAFFEETGNKTVTYETFIPWLKPRTGSVLWPMFFGEDDAVYAERHRRDLFRRLFGSGEMSVVLESLDPPSDPSEPVVMEVVSVPSALSPLNARALPSEYHPVRVRGAGSAEDIRELNLQASKALRSWLVRYAGVLRMSGISSAPVESMIGTLVNPSSYQPDVRAAHVSTDPSEG